MGEWKEYTITVSGWKAKLLLLAVVALAFYAGTQFEADALIAALKETGHG